MHPGQLDLTIDKGTTYRLALRYKRRSTPDGDLELVDLTGWHARAQVRDRPGGLVLLTLDSDPTAAPDGTITLSDAGDIALEAESEATARIAEQLGVWALVLTDPGGSPVRLLQGDVIFNAVLVA